MHMDVFLRVGPVVVREAVSAQVLISGEAVDEVRGVPLAFMVALAAEVWDARRDGLQIVEERVAVRAVLRMQVVRVVAHVQHHVRLATLYLCSHLIHRLRVEQAQVAVYDERQRLRAGRRSNELQLVRPHLGTGITDAVVHGGVRLEVAHVSDVHHTSRVRPLRIGPYEHRTVIGVVE